MGLKLVTPPADLAVTLARAKQHLRVDIDDDDELITGYLQAATDTIDGRNSVIGRAIMPQTWELYLDAFPRAAIKIPFPPLIGIDFVTYIATDGTTKTVDPATYRVDAVSEPGWVVPGVSGWPTDVMTTINAVCVRFQAGYAPISQSPVVPNSGVPAAAVQAILLMVGSFYENRAQNVIALTISELPFGVDAVLSPLRKMSI